jgi:hypothetical protein
VNKELFKALARCGVIEQKMAESRFGISKQQFDEWVEKKMLAREWIQDKDEVLSCYRLTGKGEQFVKEHIPEIQEIYRGFILEHDLCLMEFYLKRTQSEKDTWLTRDDMIKKYKLPGTIDGAFMNEEGKWEGIEVLSSTATFSSVERVETFLKETGIEKMNYILY